MNWREGDWKLILGCAGIFDKWYPKPLNNHEFNSIKAKDSTTIYLFNIKEDPLEINNLASDFPDLVIKLEQKLNEYRKKTVEPLNPPSLKPDQKADPTNW